MIKEMEKQLRDNALISKKVRLSDYYPDIADYFRQDYEFSLINQNLVSLNIILNIILRNKYGYAVIVSAFEHIRNTPNLHGQWIMIPGTYKKIRE